MEREEMSLMPVLPEDLVEKVLGMVPFPYIFKARALSKSWLARLSPVSSHDDDQEISCLAISFQRLMSEYWTAKWTFCPVYLHKGELIFYDPASSQLKCIPLLSFLPENCIKSKLRQLRGALLITVPWPDRRDLLVANIVTRTSRRLPRPSVLPLILHHSGFEIALVIHKETYRVISLYDNKDGLSYALIYDSKVNAWKTKRVEMPQGFRNHGRGVYLNGVVHWLVGPEDTRGLLLFEVEEEIFVFLEMPSTDASSYLTVCAGSLLIVISYEHERGLLVTVKTVDIESRSWLEVTRGPPKAACNCLWSKQFEHVVIDRDCLFFQAAKRVDDKVHIEKVIVYNVQNDQWTSLHIPLEDYILGGFNDYFDPGLNPFMPP